MLYPKICPRIFPQEIAASGVSWFFKLAQESVKQTFLVSQTQLGFLLIFQGSGLFHTVGLGFWLTLTQFWSGERSLAFNQELGFSCAVPQKDLILRCFASYSEIWVEFALFDLISKRRHLVWIHVRLIEPVKRNMQFGFKVLGKKSLREECVWSVIAFDCALLWMMETPSSFILIDEESMFNWLFIVLRIKYLKFNFHLF